MKVGLIDMDDYIIVRLDQETINRFCKWARGSGAGVYRYIWLMQEIIRIEKMFKVPSNQTLWAIIYDGKHNPVWAITSDAARIKYCLYKMTDGKPLKVKTGKSPKEFEKEVGRV